LPLVLEDGRNASARLAMANAALLAGVSFSNSMVGIVHAMGHSCGGQCSVAHGDAMGILLPHGMEFNVDHAGPRYAELLLHLAGPEVYASTPAADRAAAAIETVRAMLQFTHERAGMPTKLSEVGVTLEQLPGIATAAMNDGSMTFNPRYAEESDVLQILKAAL